MSALKSSRISELTVSGYIHELQNKLNIDIAQDIVLVIIMFYPSCIQFEGNTLNLTLNEKQTITSWFIDVFNLDNTSSISAKLLYRYNKDGTCGEDFHKKCDKINNQFSIIETEFAHIFGCFVSPATQDEGMGKYRADEKAFLCVIRSSFQDKEAEIYKIKEKKSKYAYFDVCLCFDKFK
eukprot:UN02999